MAYEAFSYYYDILMQDVPYSKWMAKTKQYLPQGSSILDVGCGTGTISILLAKEGYDVTGIDLSEDMLREAFDKFKEARIKGKIICQDMTELSLNKEFDLITSVLDSTNYITDLNDLQNYFNGVYNHLKSNGLFIFDVNSYYKLSEILGNNIYTYSEEEVFYTWENVFEDSLLSMFLTFFVKKGDLYERFEEEHLERAYTEKELEQELKKANLEVIAKFDGYTENYVQANTERIVYVIRKKQ
ncbi:class I SAM-dependent methyltransferase [uncultured Turicibacter sp.]|uniref:class I SAM-dependent DNA methyltransferase n=1 Tax=uncultured Turicibacter sp. TaxID=297316 RepID=UPI002596C2FF|nr:class I SAM-dependent methyltransferase [uncultured Turicibacter sp.]